MYADDAVTECGCDRMTVTSIEGLRAFWQRRLVTYPAPELENLRPYAGGATISYVTGERILAATMEFNAEGRISRLGCGSAK
jgi:hypothetical protein